MKNYNKIIVIVVITLLTIIVGVNIVIFTNDDLTQDKSYLVEGNRYEEVIKKEGLESIDRFDGQIFEIIIYNEETKDEFYSTDSAYFIKEINGDLYRFSYNVKGINTGLVITTNVVYFISSFIVILVLFYLRKNIIKPFDELSELPYKLAQRNLNVGIKENKYKYFGKFTWGLNMLRESLEEAKVLEYEYEKDRKTLVLSISHDINTPLSSISLYAKALEKGLYDNDKTKEVANTIFKHTEEISSYVNEIVKSQTEDILNIDVNDSEFYLDDLVLNIKTYYKEKLELLKINFEINKIDNLLLKGDLDKAIECVQNVVENAIKYGDGKLIKIDMYEEDGHILFVVANTGSLISLEDSEHIFESFYRGTNRKNVKGSGLGLYITKRIMLKMDGDAYASNDNEMFNLVLVFKMI